MTRGTPNPQDAAAKARLAKRVRELRTDWGHSQRSLAESAGLSTMTVYWLERSGRANLDTVRAVARVLEVDPSVLLDGE